MKIVLYEDVKSVNKYGIDVNDITPYIDGDRELEINEYLKIHPEIEQLLILGDDYVINSSKEHRVFLDLYKGICEEHVNLAVDILNGKLGFYPPNFNFSETLEERNIRINEYHSKKR